MSFLINPYAFRQPAPATIERVGITAKTLSSSVSTMTFSGVSVGAAATDRYVFVHIALLSNNASPKTVSSVTIGGVAATIHVSPSVSTIQSVIASAPLAAGLTTNVVIDLSGSTFGGCYLTVFRATGLASATPVDTAAIVGSGASFAVQIDEEADGFVVAGAKAFGVAIEAGSYRISGLANNVNTSVGGSQRVMVGWEDTAATAADQPVTAIVKVAGSPSYCALAVASFR